MRPKHWILLGITFAYFGVWFGFGWLYRSAAQWSHGTDFSFVSDILSKSRVDQFKDSEKTNVDDGYIQAILDYHGYGFQCSTRVDHDLLPLRGLPICVRPLRLPWALYYMQRFVDKV
jgi:hypothetical protein